MMGRLPEVPWKRALWIAAGVAALAAAAGLAFWRGPMAPVAVSVAKISRASLEPQVFGIGTIEARRAYAVGPTQAARVLRVLVDHGDVVRAGQLLAELDPVDLRDRLTGADLATARAEEAVRVAEAQVREAQSRNEIALANAARYRDLALKHFVSKEAAEVRQNESNVTRAGLEAAQAALQAAHRDAARAARERDAVSKQLANLRLVSPVDGIVVSRSAEPGTTVVAGQAVVRLIDPASLWVQARIDQARAAGLALGQPAEIVLRSRQSSPLAGRVARIELESDAVTEERVVAVAFAEPMKELSVGELAEVTIRLPKLAETLTVPTAAVKRVDDRLGVWQQNGGSARFRPIRIGVQTLDGRTQVFDGLAAGDEVIVHSTAQLAEGMPVRVRR
jgi:HlyD family secretion protein